MKKKKLKKLLAVFLASACLPISSFAISAEVKAADGAEVTVDINGDTVTIGNA